MVTNQETVEAEGFSFVTFPALLREIAGKGHKKTTFPHHFRDFVGEEKTAFGLYTSVATTRRQSLFQEMAGAKDWPPFLLSFYYLWAYYQWPRE